MNTERLSAADLCRKIVDQAETFPETFEMREWASDCGTACCLGGWAEYFITSETGSRPSEDEIAESLGMTPLAANSLFIGHWAGKLGYPDSSFCKNWNEYSLEVLKQIEKEHRNKPGGIINSYWLDARFSELIEAE